MPNLAIDINYLLFAWQDSSEDSQYYLDIETGSVLLLQPDLDDINELMKEIEFHPNRYLYIPKPNVEQSELDLFDFIHTVEDGHLKSLLLIAAETKDKIYSCRNLLAKYPHELKRWQDFVSLQTISRIKKWLKANNIQFES
jgi:hypothetical protein